MIDRFFKIKPFSMQVFTVMQTGSAILLFFLLPQIYIISASIGNQHSRTIVLGIEAVCVTASMITYISEQLERSQ